MGCATVAVFAIDNKCYLGNIVNSIKDIVLNNFCSGCGACVAICPFDAVQMCYNEQKGEVIAKIDKNKCQECGKCLSVCSGLVFDHFPDVRKEFFVSDNLCNADKAYIACSSRDETRINGASGGLLSEILCYMLESGMIDGAIVSSANDGFSGHATTKVVRSSEEILENQGSIYCSTSTNAILKGLDKFPGKLAYVGLPCQVLALRLLQRQHEELKAKIPYVLGLFCSRTPRAHATSRLLNKLKVDPQKISRIKYRGGGHPGFFKAYLAGGKIVSVQHLHKWYWGHAFYRFFKPWRCWLCPDHSAELADVSFADDWSKPDAKGRTVAVTRDQRIDSILHEMANDGQLQLETFAAANVVGNQLLPYKCNTVPRYLLARLSGFVYPGKKQPVRGDKGIGAVLKEIPEWVRIMSSSRLNVLCDLMIRMDYIYMQIPALFKKLVRIPGKLIRAVKIFKPIPPIARPDTKKLVMVGGYGWLDIGDEAMPKADVIKLRAAQPEIDIMMLSADPAQTLQYHGESSAPELAGMNWGQSEPLKNRCRAFVKFCLFLVGAVAQKLNIRLQLWENAREVLDHIYTCDVFFNVGGGNLNSIMHAEMYKKCTQYLACWILGKPVIISGQSIGPFYNELDKKFLKFCLNRASILTFRDKNNSINTVQSLGVSKPVLADTADDAITLPILFHEEGDRLWKSTVGDDFVNDDDLVVAFNLKGSLVAFKGKEHKGELGNEIDVMAKLADRLIREYNAKIIFVPTDYSEGVDDRVYHRQIFEMMHNKHNVVHIEKVLNDIELKTILSRCSVAIGARYHFCVFAASDTVPFVGIASGIYQQQKLRGLANLCELPFCFIEDDLESADIDSIWVKVDHVLRNMKEVKNTLRITSPRLKKASHMTIEFACRFLR